MAKNIKIKTTNLNMSLKELKITNFLINARNAKKGQWKPINGLFKKFSNSKKFCNNDINKFILLLKKVLILMNSWERFDETTIPYKEALYSELNLEGISDGDYIRAQKGFEEFKLKNWVSWLTCSKWYFIACRCIWKF